MLKSIFVIFRQHALPAHAISQFRGFLNQQLSWQDDYFHNHTSEKGGVVYRYPRIQYRSYQGCAALFGIQEGYEALDDLLRNQLDRLPALAGRFDRLEQRTSLQVVPELRSYSMHYWLGLNRIKNRDGSITNLQQNWEELPDDEERSRMLERILTAQLLKFCGEMGCRLPEGSLRVRIRAFQDAGWHTLRSETGQPPFQAFHLRYESNLVLPDFVAFGKGVSKGFGWQLGEAVRPVGDRRH